MVKSGMNFHLTSAWMYIDSLPRCIKKRHVQFKPGMLFKSTISGVWGKPEECYLLLVRQHSAHRIEYPEWLVLCGEKHKIISEGYLKTGCVVI